MTLADGDYTYTEYGDNAQRMLYDRKKDPSENENVAEAEEYKERVNQLSKLPSEGQKKAQPRTPTKRRANSNSYE